MPLSPLQTIDQKAGNTDVTVVYSRPAKRDRVIFGGLVPFNELWRTGANQNTKITFSEDVVIGGKTVEPGSYSIFTKPHADFWEVFIYAEVDKFGVPQEWDLAKIVAQTIVQTTATERVAQSFSISLDDLSNEKFLISLYWDQTMVSVPVELTTEKRMTETIADVLSGPDADDYYLAAQYRLESNRNLADGLTWINKAIQSRGEKAWYDNWIKTRILVALDRKAEAKTVATEGLELAKVAKSNFGTTQLTTILEGLE